MVGDREDFLGLLVTTSDDDPVWGVVADWLWEQGDPLAGFVRHQADLRSLDRDDPSRMLLMRYCPPGTFLMGSPRDEGGRIDDEDQVEVRLSRGFWMATYPVTQDEYASLTGSNPSWFSSSGGGQEKVAGEATDRFPVELVSWEDAVGFCRGLTDRDRSRGVLPPDWAYRLPSEAQWEYGCRAGTTTAYCFGDKAWRLLNFGGAEQLADYAWFGGNSGGTTHPVGLKRSNAWGLHDVHGNVWEWCCDWYANRLPGGVDPEVVAQASFRVIRGGGWNNGPRYCRAAFRSFNTLENWYFSLGFRPVAVQVSS